MTWLPARPAAETTVAVVVELLYYDEGAYDKLYHKSFAPFHFHFKQVINSEVCSWASSKLLVALILPVLCSVWLFNYMSPHFYRGGLKGLLIYLGFYRLTTT